MSSSELRAGHTAAGSGEPGEGGFARFLRDKERQCNHAPLRIADLRVAFLCLQDPELGASVVEHDYLDQLPAQLARLGLAAEQIDEVRQRVRNEVLFGAPPQPPQIGAYQGRDELKAFLRSAATRIALRLLRDQRTVDAAAGTPPDRPELALLGQAVSPAAVPCEQTYTEELNRGLQCALDGLPPWEQALLHQYFVEGVSIDRLAMLHRVHRTAVMHQVHAAQETLRAATFAHVARALRVPANKLDGVDRWVQSQLGVSLHRLHTSGQGDSHASLAR